MALIDRKRGCVFVRGIAYLGIPTVLCTSTDGYYLVDEITGKQFTDELKEIMFDTYVGDTGDFRELFEGIRDQKYIGMRFYL